MGQKVNPHGLRVGIIKDWDSNWYADKRNDEFAKNLAEDQILRKYLKTTLYKSNISKICLLYTSSIDKVGALSAFDDKEMTWNMKDKNKNAKTEEKTNVMRILDSKKIKYNHYCYVETGETNGEKVAAILGQDPAYVYKTLVTVSYTHLSHEDSQKVSIGLHVIGDLERMSDHAITIADICRKMNEAGASFSEKAKSELGVYKDCLLYTSRCV